MEIASLGTALSAKNFAKQLSSVLGAVFFEQIGSVELDGARANLQRASHFLTGKPVLSKNSIRREFSRRFSLLCWK